MEKRIELELRGRSPVEVVDLNLDNCRSTHISGLTDEFTCLQSLSLINVGLTTLKGFPGMPALKRLELSDNRLAGGLDALTSSKSITHLNLSGNKIKDLEALKPLQDLLLLKSLDLFNNEVTSIATYRDKLFELLPQMKYLDGFDREDLEADDSEEDVAAEEEADEEINGDVGDAGEDDDHTDADEDLDGDEDEEFTESDEDSLEDEESDVDDLAAGAPGALPGEPSPTNGHEGPEVKLASENSADGSASRGAKRKHGDDDDGGLAGTVSGTGTGS